MIRNMNESERSAAFATADIMAAAARTALKTNGLDNRVMYSVGRAAIRLGPFPYGTRPCCGIPLYTGAKSIFFDRAPGSVLLAPHD